VVIDGALDDWTSIPTTPGDPGASAGADPVSIGAAHDDRWLFLKAEFFGEIDIEEGSAAQLFIDTDDNPATGLSVGQIGAEVEFRFGQRSGFWHAGGQPTPIEAPALSLRGGPSVDSDAFEFAIAREALGGPQRVRALVRSGTSGLQAPAGGAGLLYEFE